MIVVTINQQLFSVNKWIKNERLLSIQYHPPILLVYLFYVKDIKYVFKGHYVFNDIKNIFSCVNRGKSHWAHLPLICHTHMTRNNSCSEYQWHHPTINVQSWKSSLFYTKCSGDIQIDHLDTDYSSSQRTQGCECSAIIRSTGCGIRNTRCKPWSTAHCVTLNDLIDVIEFQFPHL